jgi:hypothetical protein
MARHRQIERKAGILAILAVLLAGCNGSGGSAFTTGTAAPAAPLKPAVTDDVSTRAVQAATTSVRAEKCGFTVDLAKLEANYVAYETSRGTTADDLTKIGRGYTAGRKLLRNSFDQDPDYCSNAMVEKTRSDLARNLAGDFSAQ